MNKLWNQIINCIKQGKEVELVTVIKTSGSVPRGAGAKMLVDKNGILIGTIGGGAIEYNAIHLAIQAIEEEKSFMRNFSLNKDEKSELGMVCGGEVTVYFQYLGSNNKALLQLGKSLEKCVEEECWIVTDVTEPGNWEIGLYTKQNEILGIKKLEEIKENYFTEQLVQFEHNGQQYYSEPFVQEGKLYIFGGGHVAQEIVPVASHVGFSCIVFDDRKEFANKTLFPLAEDTIVGDFEHIIEKLTITENDYVAIMSRGHEYDYIIQKQMLETPAYYIGVMGSKKKLAYLEEKLLNEGFTKENMKRFQSPIGTAILAETPEEIAISVVSELIRKRAIKRGK